MAYVIPTDLELKDVTWKNWPLAKRIEVTRWLDRWSMIPVKSYATVAVAITQYEQPGKVPCGNPCGLMCFGKAYPWGWSKRTWEFVRPSGYFLCHEGQTGNQGVFFAFPSFFAGFIVLYGAVLRRKIKTGRDYATKWVGLNKESAIVSTAKEFEKMLAKVRAEGGA